MKLFFFFSILHALYARVAARLQDWEKDLSCSGLVYGVDQLAALREAGFPAEGVTAFTRFLSTRLRHPPDVARLTAWESEHGVPLSYLLAADRLYWRKSRGETLRLASAAVECVRDALDRHMPDVIVAEGIDCLLSYVLYYEARARRLPFLITYAAPLPKRFAIYGNPFNRWDEVDRRYLEFTRHGLTDAQVDVADQWIARYTRDRVVPSYMGAYRTIFHPRRDLRTLAGVVRRHVSDPIHRYNPTYHGSLGSIVAQRAARVLRAAVARSAFFDRTPPAERFVLFPLQLQPEASTLVLAPFFTDQVYAAECIAKSLPIDHVLYVKEHPAMVGRRLLADYLRLRSLPNVRLISPDVHSHDLIQRASAVAVITSTVGWEAAIYRKPVIVLGNVWYDAFDVVRKIHSISDLPHALHQAVRESGPALHPLRCAVMAVLDGTYPGEIDNPAFNPGVLGDANVAMIADALVSHLPHRAAAGVSPVIPALAQ